VKKNMKEETSYDIGYNLTEEIRQLLDADYKKDINAFETAKNHILLLLDGKELDIKEYTDMKKKLVQEFYKNLDERLNQARDEQTIWLLTQDLEAFSNAYNSITLRYMDDTVRFLMDYVNTKQ
jgi:hypothetical protein